MEYIFILLKVFCEFTKSNQNQYLLGYDDKSFISRIDFFANNFRHKTDKFKNLNFKKQKVRMNLNHIKFFVLIFKI